MENKSSKVYTGIDVFKLIAAVMIVLLHTIETTNYYACLIKEVFTRFAVPFFFIASGFFLYNGLERAFSKGEYFRKYEKNILIIFGVWAIIIYSPFVIYEYITNNSGESVIKIIAILIRRILVIGPGPYWYLVALFWAAAFIYFFYTRNKENILWGGMVIGFCMQIAYVCFRGALSEVTIFNYFFKGIYGIFSWEYNVFMYGIPFMGIGYLLNKKEVRVKSKTAIMILIICTMFSAIEYSLPQIFPNVFWKENKIFIAFIGQAIAYFWLAQNMNLAISKKESLTIRQLSSFIYFSHVILLYNILNPLLSNYTDLPIYEPYMILPKLIIVIVVCVGLFWSIKKIKNKYLNVLING